jgi:preprotein translocase subunit SecF
MRDLGIRRIPYEDYSNRQVAAIPLAVLALALILLTVWSVGVTGTVSQPGTPVSMGVDFTGGTEIHVATTGTAADVAETLPVEVESSRAVGGQGNEYLLTTQAQDTSAIESALQDAGYQYRDTCTADGGATICSVNTRSAAFGATAQQTALIGVALAFVGMALLIFVLFRTFVPSLAVIASAFSDIVVPLALMNVFGIDLSLGTVAALLMLIGYSVDSDILLNNHILRRRGDFYESTYRAMETGVTMTLTSLSAMIVMTLVANVLAIPLLPDIGIVLVFGLATDLLNTYAMNLSLLRWYKFEGVAR